MYHLPQHAPEITTRTMARNVVFFNCSELSTVFSIDTTARPGPNGTKYMGFQASVPGKKGRLMVRVAKEKHVGQIPPLDDGEVTRINAERGSKYGGVKKRDRHPTLNVQLYKPQTDDLPSDDEKSEYFRVCQFVNEFFYETMQERFADASIIHRDDARHMDSPAGAIVVPSTRIVSVIQTHVSREAKVNSGARRCRTRSVAQT